MEQENKHPPKQNPLEQGETRKHAPQQGPDIVPPAGRKIEMPPPPPPPKK